MANKERKRQKDQPTVAPGVDDGAELNRKATRQEVERGDSTRVTHVAYDEVDASK